MKVRLDYVTNSSSSSFIIVGVEQRVLIDKLMIAEDKDGFRGDYGVDYGKLVNFYGCYNTPYYAGIDIETLMETMTLPQIKEYFKDLLKNEYNIEVNESEINLYYGEVGE